MRDVIPARELKAKAEELHEYHKHNFDLGQPIYWEDCIAFPCLWIREMLERDGE